MLKCVNLRIMISEHQCFQDYFQIYETQNRTTVLNHSPSNIDEHGYYKLDHFLIKW